jgi:hypothetical protein
MRGSRAGQPTLAADCKMLNNRQRAIKVKRASRPRFVSMDVLVKTPEEVEARLERGSFFLSQILEQGKVLYEREP